MSVLSVNSLHFFTSKITLEHVRFLAQWHDCSKDPLAAINWVLPWRCYSATSLILPSMFLTLSYMMAIKHTEIKANFMLWKWHLPSHRLTAGTSLVSLSQFVYVVIYPLEDNADKSHVLINMFQIYNNFQHYGCDIKQKLLWETTHLLQSTSTIIESIICITWKRLFFHEKVVELS